MSDDPIFHVVDGGADLQADGNALFALLADAVAMPPPPDLRGAVLAAAHAVRAPLVPIGEATAVTPVEAYTRSTHQMYDLLAGLQPQQWDTMTGTAYGRVRDLVAHLAAIEDLTAVWVDGSPPPPGAEDHVGISRAAIDALATAPVADVLDRWWDNAQRVINSFPAANLGRPVMAHDIPTDLDGALVLRTFETWSHVDDIRVALGEDRAPLDPGRTALMSSRLMDVLPFAVLAVDSRPDDFAGQRVRMVLTGPGGGTYDVPMSANAPDHVTMTVVTDAVQLCRVAARRLDADATSADIDGDQVLGRRLLSTVGAFARD